MNEYIGEKRRPYNKIINNLAEMIIYMDANFNIQWANKAALEYFDINLDNMSNKKCYEKWGLDNKCEGCPVIESGRTKQTEEMVMEKSDDRIWKMKAIPDLSETGEIEGFIEIALDITEKTKIEEISLFDPNSGLPNSSNLIKKVNELREEKEVLTNDLYLLMMDIENYEDIMNTIGHTRWGRFIKEIATQLKERQEINFIYNNRKKFDKDMEINVYNIYHGKVGFLLENISTNKLTEFVEELKKHINSPFYYNKIPIFLNSHLGLASYNKGDTGVDLLQHAYQAMNAAGRDKKRIKIYEKSLEKETKENFFLLGEVRNAIDENQFQLYYMPKVKLSTGKIEGVEALIRWKHPEQGNISPGKFIPPVEKTGLINELTNWVINKAAEEKKLLNARGIDVNMAINISPRNLMKEDFIADIKNILSKSDLSPAQFELELTETEIMEELIGGNSSLELLSKEGFKISMDDFGTGYSSLAYLKNLDINSIKIDLSFVQAMGKDKKSYEIVKTAIRLGQILDKKIVAEGIENQDVMEELNKLGCDYGQGFYICKPMPREDFVEFYNRWQD